MNMQYSDSEDEEAVTKKDIVEKVYDLDHLLILEKTRDILKDNSYHDFVFKYGNKIKNIYNFYRETYSEYNFLDKDKYGNMCDDLIDMIYSFSVKEYPIDDIFDNEDIVNYLFARLERQ